MIPHRPIATSPVAGGRTVAVSGVTDGNHCYDDLLWWLAQRSAYEQSRQTTRLQLSQFDQQLTLWAMALSNGDRALLASAPIPAAQRWLIMAALDSDVQLLTSAQALAAAEMAGRIEAELLDERQRALVGAWRGHWQPLSQLPLATDRAGLAQLAHAPAELMMRVGDWLNGGPQIEQSDLICLGAAVREADAPALVSLIARELCPRKAIWVAASSGWSRFVPWLADLMGVTSLRQDAFIALDVMLGEQMSTLLPVAVLADEEPWQDDDAVNLLQRQLARRWLPHQGARLLAGMPLRPDHMARIWQHGHGQQRTVAAAHHWLLDQSHRWHPANGWLGGDWPCQSS